MKPEDENIIDEALSPVSEFMSQFSKITGVVNDQDDIAAFSVEKVTIDTPIELDVYVNDEGKVTIGSAPPTQHIETSFMPVFHQLKITISKEDEFKEE